MAEILLRLTVICEYILFCEIYLTALMHLEVRFCLNAVSSDPTFGRRFILKHSLCTDVRVCDLSTLKHW